MRRIAVVGDTHVGSKTGLWPETYQSRRSGITINAGRPQMLLLKYWHEYWAGIAKDVDTVFLIGDLCQGNNRKDWGAGTTTPDLANQVEAAVQLFEPHMSGKTIIGVSGSRYHDSLDTSLDRQIVERLGGRFMGALANIELKGTGGKVVNMAHGDGPPLQYPGTWLNKESDFLDMSIGKGAAMTHKVDVFIRGHYHEFDMMDKGHRVLMCNPCWQFWFDWVKLVKYYGRKKMAHLGATVLEIDDEIRVIKYLCENPAVYDRLEKV